MLMSIFKASSKKGNFLCFRNHNFLFVRAPQHETYYDPRFGRKIEKSNMFFKAIYGEQQKKIRENYKLLEPQSSNGMKSSDFVADRTCFCLLRSFMYVQRL